MIEHYERLRTPQLMYWPHHVLAKAGKNINKYKFSYALKAFVLFNVYSEFSDFKFRKATTIMRLDQESAYYVTMFFKVGAASAVMCYL